MALSCTSLRPIGIGGWLKEFSWPPAIISSTHCHVLLWAHGGKIATSSFSEYIHSRWRDSCGDFKHSRRGASRRQSGRQAFSPDLAKQSERSLHQGMEGLCGGGRSLSLCDHTLCAREGYLRHLRQFAERKNAGRRGRKSNGKLHTHPRQLQRQDQHRWRLRDRRFEVGCAYSSRKAALQSRYEYRPHRVGWPVQPSSDTLFPPLANIGG